MLIIRSDHDAWTGHRDLLAYIKVPSSLYKFWKAVAELNWPNGPTAGLDSALDHVGTSSAV